MNVVERMTQLTLAEQNGDLDAALEGVVWVWKNPVDDAWGALRETVLIGVMQRLTAAYPKARTTIAALREQSVPGSNDWNLLCRALGEFPLTGPGSSN